VLYGGLFAWVVNQDYTICSRLGRYFWDPKSFAWILYPHHAPSVALIGWMQLIWKISLLASCFGLATRFSTAIACVFGIVLLELPNNLGKVDHPMAAVCLALIVMALSQCGRIWSLDGVISRARGKEPAALPTIETGWPIQVMRVILALVYFCAACDKLRQSGLAWIFSENMQTNLIQQNAGGIAPWLVQHPNLCMAMAAYGLATEFFQPLSLFSKRLAFILVPAGIGMFAGIYLSMGFNFLPLVFLHFFWLPWGRLFRSGPGSGLAENSSVSPAWQHSPAP